MMGNNYKQFHCWGASPRSLYCCKLLVRIRALSFLQCESMYVHACVESVLEVIELVMIMSD